MPREAHRVHHEARRTGVPGRDSLLREKNITLIPICKISTTPPPPRPQPAPLPMLVLPDWMVRHTTKPGNKLAQDDLVNWLRTGIKWDSAQRARFDQVLSDYRLGYSSKSFMTVFWQIDEKGNVRTGKMMRYKPTGPRQDLLLATLFRSKADPRRYSACSDCTCCTDTKRIAQTVNLVESEKTAIIIGLRQQFAEHVDGHWWHGEPHRGETGTHHPGQEKIVCWPDRDGIAGRSASANSRKSPSTPVTGRSQAMATRPTLPTWWCAC